MSEMIIESPDEVIAFLKAQHNLIEDMFDQVLNASDPHAREKPFVQLRQLLAVHETAEEMTVALLSTRRETAPFGLNGGGDGAKGKASIVWENGSDATLGGREEVAVVAGETVVIETPGGGGFGVKP